MSDAPAIAVRDDDSVLPGAATADLDWDDQEESTHVFADSHDLFGEIEAHKVPKQVRVDADDTAKRNVGMAAALLKQSGKAAAAVPMVQPVQPTPAPPPMVQIPAPAPIPRELPRPTPTPQPIPRPQEPSWQPPPAAGQARRGPVPYLVALVAVVAIIAVVLIVLRGEKGGTLRIDVTYQGASVDVAEVYIEGQKRCDNTPCIVKDLKAGKYNVKVVAKDRGSKVLDVQIDSGAETPVTIDVGGGAPQPQPDKTGSPPASQTPPPASGPASIKLASKQGGVKVIIEGVEKTTLEKGKPYELKDLKPGTIKIKLVGPKEFAAKELEVDVAAGASKDLGEIALTLLKVKVTLTLATADAAVKLTNEDDKKSETLDFKKAKDNKIEQTLDTSKRWTLEATKKGYTDYREPITFEDDAPEKTIKIELVKAPEGEPPLVGTTSATTGPVTTAPPPPVAAAKATISMNSIPPSNVLLDGQPLGLVPQTKQVEPGTHSVTFIHKTRGTKQRTVTVAAGDNKAVSVTFKAEE